MATTSVAVASQQSLASIIRQIVAVAALIAGPLTASLSSIKLPVAISAIITAFGVIIIALEHYLSDPSTGTTSIAVVPVVPVSTTGAGVPVLQSLPPNPEPVKSTP